MTMLSGKDQNFASGNASIYRRKPRICMLTQRGFAHDVFRSGFYESQDVLWEIDDVDLFHQAPLRAFDMRERFQRKIIRHDFTRQLVSAAVPIQPVRLTREYDLFIAYFPLIKDIPQISTIHGWKDYSRISICWIDEFWRTDITKYKFWLPILNDFDHVILGLHGTVKALNNVIKQPCHWVPDGVDTIRFSPYPHPPARVVDIYSIGRISHELHQTFLAVAARKKLFYIHDTFDASMAKVADYRQHRNMIANIAKRSRYFFVSPAKSDQYKETADQIEVGLRFYEASAAGAVMLGQVPQCESFRTMFNWPDPVIAIQPDGSDAADVIENIAAQPERLLEISRRNATEALLHHDWVYRWKKILDIAGLKPMPELELREQRLKQMAEQAGNGK